jgi:hypothetical protein
VYTKNLPQPPLDYFAHQQELAAIATNLEVSTKTAFASHIMLTSRAYESSD